MIFVAPLVIWFLQTFDTRINVVADSADSMLARSAGLFLRFSRPWALEIGGPLPPDHRVYR